MASSLMSRNRRQPPPQLSSDEIRDRYSKIVIPEASIGTPEIDPEEIDIIHALGDGSSGTVYKGRCRQKDVAVKILQKQNLNDEELANFRREIEILSRLRHPNIVLFMGACTQVPGKLMIVTELMNSDLASVLEDPDISLTLLQRMKMAKDITLGLNWLHSNKPAIIHRDLNPSNLLVDNHLHVKIADYGLSKFQDDSDPDKMVTDSGNGTPFWIAPEILMNQPYSEKSDVYSFGIVLWQLLTRQEPFVEFDDFDTFSRAVCDEHIRPFIPADTHPSLRDLITDCWEADFRRRPPFASIVKRLDHIIVDCAVSDPHANIFWKERFLTKDEVRWRDFINLFGEFIYLTTPGSLPIMDLIAINHHRIKDTSIPLDIRCLKAVLAELPAGQPGVVTDHEEEAVRLERFGQVCDWFGPLKSNFSILERVRNVLRCGWFHGDISTQEAENRLMTKEVGTFLVRFSTSAPGAFTISKVSMYGQIHHQRISKVRGEHDQDWFVIGNGRFPSLIDLINESKQPLVLLIPCTGSKYFSLFTVQQEPSGYIDT